jgi:hypothetical protein
MLTKPAGCFVQGIGAFAVILGVIVLAGTESFVGFGVVAVLVGLGLLWLGRKTRA